MGLHARNEGNDRVDGNGRNTLHEPQPGGELQGISAPEPAEAKVQAAAQAQEQQLIRRLQMMMHLVMQTIAQDGSLSVEEASQMIADSRAAALAMFPGKELAYDLIWRPRFQRLMRDRFRMM